MKAQDLYKIWDRPDLSRLAKKSTSIRLPIIINAKISALCEMYPNNTKTNIIIDLLASALDELAEGMPSQSERDPIDYVGNGYDGPDLYEDIGVKGKFLRTTNKYIKQLEEELGNDNPQLLFVPCIEKTD